MMTVRGVPVVRGRNPVEMWLLTACVLNAASLLLGASEPSTLQQALPDWMLTAWSCALLVGSAVALAGVAIRPSWGVLIERVGLALLAPAPLVYGAAIIVVIGKPAVFAGVFIGAFGVACAARVVQITRDVHRAIKEAGG